MASAARRNLSDFPDVEVVETAFETFDPSKSDRFDLVFAATVGHWPRRRPRRTTDACRDRATDGVSRQAVRRIADLLVAQGPAEYRPNPAHRRAQLFAATEAGYWAIRQISLVQAPWAERIGATVGADELRRAQSTMQSLVEALDLD